MTLRRIVVARVRGYCLLINVSVSVVLNWRSNNEAHSPFCPYLRRARSERLICLQVNNGERREIFKNFSKKFIESRIVFVTYWQWMIYGVYYWVMEERRVTLTFLHQFEATKRRGNSLAIKEKVIHNSAIGWLANSGDWNNEHARNINVRIFSIRPTANRNTSRKVRKKRKCLSPLLYWVRTSLRTNKRRSVRNHREGAKTWNHLHRDKRMHELWHSRKSTQAAIKKRFAKLANQLFYNNN